MFRDRAPLEELISHSSPCDFVEKLVHVLKAGRFLSNGGIHAKFWAF